VEEEERKTRSHGCFTFSFIPSSQPHELSSFIFVYLGQYSFVILLWNHTNFLSPPSAAIQRPGRPLLHFHIAGSVIAGSYALFASCENKMRILKHPRNAVQEASAFDTQEYDCGEAQPMRASYYLGKPWRTSHKVRFLSYVSSIH